MKIGIIGYGRFGKLWTQMMSKFGEVLVHSRKLESGEIKLEAGKKASLGQVVDVDFLFLLVPISAMAEMCRKIKDILPERTIVVDTCSVKIFPIEQMQRELPDGQKIIGTHPLFGPDSVSRMGLKDQKIVTCQVSSSEGELEVLEKMFRDLELEVIRSTADEHDKQMARSHALVHFLGRSFAELGLEDQKIATPDYSSLLRINYLVNNDTWELFMDMQKLNPYAKEMREELMESLKKLNQKII